MKKLNKNNRGLTLIELLLGIVILAIIITPLLRAFVTGAGTENKARKYGNATAAAQNLSEQIQAFDMDDILKDASVAGVGAYYCDENGVSIGAAADTENKVNFIRLPNYVFGSSTFDALICLDAAYKSDVSVSNRMDAYLDMTAADSEAAGALASACDGLTFGAGAAPDIDNLDRRIALNITKDTENNFTVEGAFTYSTVISHIRENAEGEEVAESSPFSYTVRSSVLQNSVKIPVDSSPAFSIYLFFDGYFKSGTIHDVITINNPTKTEINAFLVNTDKNSNPAYGADINYKTQLFSADGKAPVNSLVYTNLPAASVRYYAWYNEVLRKTTDVVAGLVETAVVDRKFNVSIKLFEPGTNFTGDPVAGFDSVKLS